MKKENSSHSLLFEKLGELFYAIAAVDKKVHEQEFDALRQFVTGKWKKLENSQDPFETNAVYQMEIVFSWFDYKDKDAWECFESFRHFKKTHEHLFTQQRNDLFLKTASAIANACFFKYQQRKYHQHDGKIRKFR
ncbi:hypothetical protein G3I01_16210 [Gramella sp. MT6]|uniref:hypothetical protein n=1 Tax=Gramella sp. MT6 TaxID=2705471 RepID=UPI001C5E08AE|nr:hypothetical protein [Gramella sp. MT6]QYA26973.1 hypothetical protein G3I01_16210 [Gramella sp. MT6]